MTTFFFKLCCSTFFPSILIPSDNNCILILPQIKNTFFILAVEEQILLHCKISIWTELIAFNISNLFNHSFSLALSYNLLVLPFVSQIWMSCCSNLIHSCNRCCNRSLMKLFGICFCDFIQFA